MYAILTNNVRDLSDTNEFKWRVYFPFTERNVIPIRDILSMRISNRLWCNLSSSCRIGFSNNWILFRCGKWPATFIWKAAYFYHFLPFLAIFTKKNLIKLHKSCIFRKIVLKNYVWDLHWNIRFIFWNILRWNRARTKYPMYSISTT